METPPNVGLDVFNRGVSTWTAGKNLYLSNPKAGSNMDAKPIPNRPIAS